MRIVSTVGQLRRTLVDLVALKAGIIIAERDIPRLILRGIVRDDDEPEASHWSELGAEEGYTLRTEELEADFLMILRELGAIPDLRSSQILVLEELLRDVHGTPAVRFAAAMDATRLMLDILHGDVPPGLERLAPEVRRRFILDHSQPEQRQWDGAIPLADLFTSEAIPARTIPEQHFDQRFIDYLAAQGEDLGRIHWRQFENLCGEYFRRQGYAVEITPPRGDGGLDVKAVRHDDNSLGPELVVIQARRLSGSNTVSIDEVKAFWTDIEDSGATRGVIATTTSLERGARTFCDARKYRMSAAEAEVVAGWISTMATKRAL